MDETVVLEMANQLGIAADQAGQFVSDCLPDYAAMKVCQMGISLIIICALVVASLAFSFVCYVICRAKYDELRDGYKMDAIRFDERRAELLERAEQAANGDFSEFYRFIANNRPNPPIEPHMDEMLSYELARAGLVASGLLLVILVFVSACFVPDIIGWISYPESMLIETALHAAG